MHHGKKLENDMRAFANDTKFLGWVICICSTLFVVSLFAISFEETQLAGNTELTTSMR